MGSSFDPNRRRLAKEIYWNLRRCARSVRAYMTDQFSGKRSGVLFQELYLAAENVDLLVSDAWNQGGTTAVNYLLEIDGNYVPIKADGVALKTEDSETTEAPL